MITQCMLDRLIQDRIYEFLVYILPCSFPTTDMRQLRKRKTSSEDQSNSQLSCATPNSAIVLTAHPPMIESGNLSPLFKGLLATNGRMSVSSMGRSNSSALRTFSQSTKQPATEFPSSKLPKIGRPPKNTRPRSKSTTASVDQKLKTKNNLLRNRSLSGEVPTLNSVPLSPDNSNCNNSNEASPNTLLAITHCQSHIPALLPVTPPSNPYENPNQISDPKIRKQLNL